MNKMLTEEQSKEIRGAMREKGITTAFLAKKLNMSYNGLHSAINGYRAMPITLLHQIRNELPSGHEQTKTMPPKSNPFERLDSSERNIFEALNYLREMVKCIHSEIGKINRNAEQQNTLLSLMFKKMEEKPEEEPQ